MAWRRQPEPEPLAGDPMAGYVEAVQTAHFELAGQPVFLSGPVFGRVGTVLPEGDARVRAHPELFRPVQVPVGTVHDQLRDHPAVQAGPEPVLARRSEANMIEEEMAHRLTALGRGR